MEPRGFFQQNLFLAPLTLLVFSYTPTLAFPQSFDGLPSYHQPTGGIVDFCQRALSKSRANVKEVEKTAPLTMVFNPAAKKFIEMSEAHHHLAQTDSRLKSCPNIASDSLCVPTTFYNIFRSIHAARGGTNPDIPPEFQIGILMLSNNQMWTAQISQQLRSQYGMQLPSNAINMDSRAGMDPDVMLADNNSLILKNTEIRSEPVPLNRQPEQAMESALRATALVQAKVLGGPEDGPILINHAIAILAIDDEAKQLAISDPADPNRIRYLPFTTPMRKGRSVIMFDLPMSSGNPKTYPVYIDSAYALSSARW